MALTTVSFATTYDYTNSVFAFTDDSDYAGQSISLSDVLGNFEITDPNGTVIWNNTDYSVENGTAQAGSGTSITLAVGASATNDYYNNLYVITTGGTGSGQTRRVSDYNGTTKVATITAAWSVALDATTTYRFAFSDIRPVAALTNQTTINLSLGVDGAPMAGNYSIVYTVLDTNTGTYASSTSTFAFDFVPPIPSLGYTIDCIAPQLIVSDTTSYIVDGITPTITRTHTLYYPPSLGLAAITGTATDFSTSNFYTPATFQHTLSSVCTWVFPTYTVTLTLESEQFIDVVCDAQLCDIYCCVATLYNNWKANVGVNKILADKYIDQLTLVAGLMILIKQAIECGKNTAVAGYVSDILRIANCEPGCGCSSSAPVPVTGLGTGTNTITTISAGNGVSITSTTTGSTTNYVVNISQSILNQIAAIQAVTVVGTVSNTVTEAPTGTWTVQGADVEAGADTQLPTTTSLSVTQTGTPATLYTVKYIGRNYKLLFAFAPTTPVRTVGTSEEVIVGATWAQPAAVVTTAGDKIRCVAHFNIYDTTTARKANSICRIRVGASGGGLVGTDLTTLLPANIIWGYITGSATGKTHNNISVMVELDVTRIDATNVRVKQKTFFGGLFTQQTAETESTQVLSVPSFAAIQDWVCTVDDAVAAETQLTQFSVEFIPKV